MQVKEREKIYECEVRRFFLVDGTKVKRWTVKPVRDAIELENAEIRCKDCWGEVKVFRKHAAHAAAPHVEHKLRQDSEYCPSGMYFREAKDGREQRKSEFPVA